jgi:hypothetical protein
MTFITFSSKINTGIYPQSDIRRRNTGESSCGYPYSSSCKPTKNWTICSSRDLILIRDPVTSCSNRGTSFTRDEPFNPIRGFQSFKGSIPYWPGSKPNHNRGKSTSSSARSFSYARDCTSTFSNRSLSFAKSSSDSSFTSGSRNPPETVQNLAPAQEVRHEVSRCT